MFLSLNNGIGVLCLVVLSGCIFIIEKKKIPYLFSHIPGSGRDRMVSEPRDMIPWVCLEFRVLWGIEFR